jgi:tetrahydromethanopterin S-methyltransferase subunit B
LYIEDLKQVITIEETITTKKYDKDTGVITEEAETKRKITQDSDKVVAEEEQKGVKSHSEDSLNHIADVSKMVDSESKEESTGGQEAFGKWLGIVIGMAIVIFIVYLLKKLRVI